MKNKPTQAQDWAVAELLRNQRRKIRLTQERTARRAEISLRVYVRFECCERSLLTAGFLNVIAILRALEINEKWFIAEYLDSEKTFNMPPKPLPETQCKNCRAILPCTSGKKTRKFCCDKCRAAWWARQQYIARKTVGQGGE